MAAYVDVFSGFMNRILFSFNMLKRDWRSGALRIIFFSLLIAVASMSAVNFFIDRIEKSLRLNANEMIAADLVVKSDHQTREQYLELARQLDLKQANSRVFRSMVQANGKNHLSEVKAVDQHYPLRGQLKTTAVLYGPELPASGIPQPGSVWIEPSLFMRLGLQTGDSVTLGSKQFVVSAILSYEPDRGSGMFNIAPRVMLNMQDLAATGLVQEGSRIKYHLLLAGQTESIVQFSNAAQKLVSRGERLIEVTDAREEVRDALQRAQLFLGLAALVSLILAAVAMAMAVRTYVNRHYSHCAVMRCIGARQGFIMSVYILEMLWLSIIAGIAGCLAGYVGHAFLVDIVGKLITVELPAPSAIPVLYGMATSIVLVMVFILPTLLQLANVPTMHVIRRELGTIKLRALTAISLGSLLIAVILVWQANDLKLGLYMFAGVLASIVVLASISWLLILVLKQFRSRLGVSWRFGMTSIVRRARASIVQIMAFGIGIMALLLMSFVTNDMLKQWQDRLPEDTPNRFVINIQKNQVEPVKKFFAEQNMPSLNIYPMVRGRLQKINGKQVSADDYASDRAKHLVEREFNLSWAQTLQQGNKILKGKWWDEQKQGDETNQLSLEEGMAKNLGVTTGDKLEFTISGESFTMSVQNIRSVAWDSFRVNFFAVASPGQLESYPASYVTSFYLPENRQKILNQLVQQFPNLTVVDISSIMDKVRLIISRVTDAVQSVFIFTLLAGLVVLYAAILATQDERTKECAMLRTFGANRRQLIKGLMSEFILLGAMAGFVAALMSTILAYFLAEKVMHISYSFNLLIWLIGPLGGGLGVGLAGLLGVRSILKQPPIQVLRKLNLS